MSLSAFISVSFSLCNLSSQVAAIQWSTQDDSIHHVLASVRHVEHDLLIPFANHPTALAAVGVMYRILDLTGFLKRTDTR